MAQRLIVEGNDAIVLSELLIKRGVKPPKDYSTKEKYKEEFVKRANSISKANYFDASLPAADNFVKWFENTFELEI